MQGKESFKTRIKDTVSSIFKNVLRYCVLHCCFVFYLRYSMYNKTIIEFGLSYSASADNTYLALENSGYHEKPHPIIVYIQRHQTAQTTA